MIKKTSKPETPVSPENKLGYKLEIGKHTFKERILDNCIYVDKTQTIYELMSRDSNCFLSRPRRFGKSLLISTFKEIFSGNKELFKNCWIYDKIDWQEYPIIHLDFLDVPFKGLGLERALFKKMDLIADQFNITLTGEVISEKLSQLITILSREKKVVVLIDEYDKPIIDYMENLPEAKKNRDILKDFYSILKAKSADIKFLFITGVTKFSKISIFSDLNHLNDITIHPQYSRMLGYTQEEIEYYFSAYITQWETQTGQNRQELFDKLKDYYNGYSWDGDYFVYNPFSILSFFGTYLFNNYWFSTGSPTFLVNKLKHTPNLIDEYERYKVDNNFFDKYDIDSVDISSLLFQTGYLTIKERIDDRYVLSYPNREVRISFFKNILEGFSHTSLHAVTQVTQEIKQALDDNRLDDFIQSIKLLLSSIPYAIQIENREAYYHSIIYIALQLSMLDVQAEIQTALGRSDIIVSTARTIYIMEFKMTSAQSALKQIEEKQYYAPYLGKNKPILMVGISFDESKRNIGDWKVKEAPGSLPASSESDISKNAEKRRMALLMLEKKYPLEDIIILTGLSAEEIKELSVVCCR